MKIEFEGELTISSDHKIVYRRKLTFDMEPTDSNDVALMHTLIFNHQDWLDRKKERETTAE